MMKTLPKIGDVRKSTETPQGRRSRAYRAFVQVLKESPDLVDVIRNWRTRDGSPEDFSAPALGMCPILGMSPVPQPDTSESIEGATIHYVIAIELIVEGTAIDDLLDLWDLVCESLRLSKPYRDSCVGRFLTCEVEGISIPFYELTDPAFQAFLPSMADDQRQDITMISGRGLIRFTLQRPR